MRSQAGFRSPDSDVASAGAGFAGASRASVRRFFPQPHPDDICRHPGETGILRDFATDYESNSKWIPAFAGMTTRARGMRRLDRKTLDALFTPTLDSACVRTTASNQQRIDAKTPYSTPFLRFARGCAASYTFARWPKSRCV